MFQNYFVMNGVKYYTGTVIIVKNLGKEEEASFICYNTNWGKYVYQIKGCKYHVSEMAFKNALVGITNKVDNTVRIPIVKTKNDNEIDGLLLGWMWYIFLMLISVIFKDAIGLWILISIVFFNWRAKKIKKEGKYIEW